MHTFRPHREALELATRYKNKLPGKVYRYQDWIRLRPGTTDVVEIFSPLRWNGSNRILAKEAPLIVGATLYPDHAVLDPGYGRYYASPLALLPSTREGRIYVSKCVCSSYNYLLSMLFGGYGVSYNGNGVYGKPGYLWRARGTDSAPNIVGPARLDYQNMAFTALEPQPVKIVDDEARKKNNLAIRTAFKRMKLLSKFNAEVTVEDFKNYEIGADFKSPEVFLAKALTFDPQSHADTVELCARAATIRGNSWWGQPDYRLYTGGNLANPHVREAVRKVLHKHAGIVRYEV